jgi:hypothetical protein
VPEKRVRPDCARESLRLRGRAPDKSRWQSFANGWRGTPPSPGLRRAPLVSAAVSARVPPPAAARKPDGTIRRAHSHFDRHPHDCGDRRCGDSRCGDRPEMADTPPARRIPSGIECVEAPRPSRQTKRASSVQQVAGEPPADRDPRSAADVLPTVPLVGVQPNFLPRCRSRRRARLFRGESGRKLGQED